MDLDYSRQVGHGRPCSKVPDIGDTDLSACSGEVGGSTTIPTRVNKPENDDTAILEQIESAAST